MKAVVGCIFAVWVYSVYAHDAPTPIVDAVPDRPHTQKLVSSLVRTTTNATPSSDSDKLSQMADYLVKGVKDTFRELDLQSGLKTGTVFDYVEYTVSFVKKLPYEKRQALKELTFKKLLDIDPTSVPPEKQLKPDGISIAAIGDLHGDYQCGKLALLLTRQFLQYTPASSSPPSSMAFLFRDPRLSRKANTVLMGDYIDRGFQGNVVLGMIRGVSNMADQGGLGDNFIPLMGNHELLNVLYPGDVTDQVSSYVNPGEYWWWRPVVNFERTKEVSTLYVAIIRKILAKLKDASANSISRSISDVMKTMEQEGQLTSSEAMLFNMWRQAYINEMIGSSWGTFRGELGRFVQGLPLVTVVGDTIFAHAGLTLHWAEKYEGDIDKINADAHKLIQEWVGKPADVVKQGTKQTVVDQSDKCNGIVFHRRFRAMSPSRSPSPLEEPECVEGLDKCEELQEIFKLVSAKESEKRGEEVKIRRMVTGHNPESIKVQCEGALIGIDNRISRFIREYQNSFSVNERMSRQCTVDDNNFGVAILMLRERNDGNFVAVRRDLKKVDTNSKGQVHLQFTDTLLDDSTSVSVGGHFVVDRLSYEDHVKVMQREQFNHDSAAPRPQRRSSSMPNMSGV